MEDKKSKWCERYIARLVVKADFTYRMANDICMDGEPHNYDDNPESAADTEASFWNDA